jgi:hypothetical protein
VGLSLGEVFVIGLYLIPLWMVWVELDWARMPDRPKMSLRAFGKAILPMRSLLRP